MTKSINKIHPQKVLRRKTTIMDKHLDQEIDSIRKEISTKSKFFFYISWVITLALAYKDESDCMRDHVLNMSFTYQTWLKIDSFTTLIFLLGIFIEKCMCCRSQQKFEVCQSEYTMRQFLQKLLERIGYVIGFFKFLWMILGLVMFASVDFGRCTMLLKNFSSIYFETFLYFTVRFILLLLTLLNIKLEKNNSKLDMNKKMTEMGALQELTDEEKKQLKEQNEINKEIRDKITFFICASWAISLSLAYKDDSTCKHLHLFNTGFTYVNWLQIDGFTTIFILSLALKNLLFCKCWSNLNCFSLKYSFLAILTLLKVGWIFFGLIFYLHIPFDGCTILFKNLSAIFYLTFIYVAMSLVLLNLERKKKQVIRGKKSKNYGGDQNDGCWTKFCGLIAYVSGFETFEIEKKLNEFENDDFSKNPEQSSQPKSPKKGGYELKQLKAEKKLTKDTINNFDGNSMEDNVENQMQKSNTIFTKI